MLRFSELIRADIETLALIETLDVGKVIGNSLAVDVPNCANCIQYYGEFADKLFDEIAATGPNDLAMVRREPLGVVGAIVPWNYPLIISAWKIGPALVAGNSIVLKPAEQSPLSAIRLASLACEAGIPPGVLNVVPGFGEEAGKPLALHTDVDMVCFTGSTGVGKLMLAYAGQSNMKRVALECGGKSPHIVMADADLDAAASGIAWGIYYNQGETCHAGSRVLVHASVKDRLIEKIAEVAQREIPLGHPLDPASQMGALIETSHMRRVLSYLDIGVKEGARIAFGGRRVMAETGGAYVEATILDGVKPADRVARDEIFRPGARCHRHRERGGGASPRQRHDLWPRCGRLDARHEGGASPDPRDQGRHRLAQLLRPLQSRDALRGLQAVRAWPRQVAPRNRQVHGPQDGVGGL